MNEPVIKRDPAVDEHQNQNSNTKASNKELSASDAIKDEDDDDESTETTGKEGLAQAGSSSEYEEPSKDNNPFGSLAQLRHKKHSFGGLHLNGEQAKIKEQISLSDEVQSNLKSEASQLSNGMHEFNEELMKI